MKELYGGAFAGSPAPTPAMMDAHVERIDAGEEGFLYGAAPAPLPRPNQRLDGKAHLMEYERWNRDWARNADDPASYAQEYESYIRDSDEQHGHDPGLIFARDFAKQVEDMHGTGGAFAKTLLTRLADRPDLQRDFLGSAVPQYPPQGTFRPGGEEGVKAWIDQDRVANGIAPKFAKSAAAQAPDAAPVPRTASRTADAPDPKNLFEYGPNYGLPEDWALAQQSSHEPDQPNPRPVEAPAPNEPEARPDATPEPPHASSAGEVDPNQMTPVPRPEMPEPLGPPDSRDPKELSDDDLRTTIVASRRDRARAEAELLSAQERLARAEADLERRMKPRHREVAEIVAKGAAMGMPQGAMTGPIIAKVFRIPAKVPTTLGTLFDAAKGGAFAGGLDQYKAYLEYRKLSEGRDAAQQRFEAAQALHQQHEEREGALTKERDGRESERSAQ